MTSTADLTARKSQSVARGVATRGIHAVRAENAELWDADYRRFIDFAAGIAVNNTGHRHPRVMAAVANRRRLSPTPAFTSPPTKATSASPSGLTP